MKKTLLLHSCALLVIACKKDGTPKDCSSPTTFDTEHGTGGTDFGNPNEFNYNFQDLEMTTKNLEVPAGSFPSIGHRKTSFYADLREINSCGAISFEKGK